MSVALVIQHANRMRRIILSLMACLAAPKLSTFSHKLYDFRESVVWTKNVCFDFLYNFLWTFFILRRIQRDIVINVHRSSREVPIILVTFWWNLNFHDTCFEKSLDLKFLENLFSVSRDACRRIEKQTYGRTDMTKLIVSFRSSANAPKMINTIYSDVR